MIYMYDLAALSNSTTMSLNGKLTVSILSFCALSENRTQAWP